MALEHPSALPGISPRKEGDQISPRLSPIFNAAELGKRPRLPISPLAEEMSDRTEGDVTELGLAWRPSQFHRLK
ncbi:hypothetical protein EN820_55860, partial [bacterium M00.F.Ca.ET.177.01.1.1]